MGLTAVITIICISPIYLIDVLAKIHLLPVGPFWRALTAFFWVARWYGRYRMFAAFVALGRRMKDSGLEALLTSDIVCVVYVICFMGVWVLSGMITLYYGFDIYQATPACVSSYLYANLVFFLMVLILPGRVGRMEIASMQRSIRERQAFIRYASHVPSHSYHPYSYISPLHPSTPHSPHTPLPWPSPPVLMPTSPCHLLLSFKPSPTPPLTHSAPLTPCPLTPLHSSPSHPTPIFSPLPCPQVRLPRDPHAPQHHLPRPGVRQVREEERRGT
jgi:hypothetical protein